MTRNQMILDLTAQGVRVDDGVSFRTDDAVERLWLRWIGHGRPPHVFVGIDTFGPTALEEIWITASEVSTGDGFTMASEMPALTPAPR